MKNLLDERPTTNLHGGVAYSRSFVEDADLGGRDVLDIDCGFDWLTLAALDAGASAVVGVEPTEHDLATARRYFSDPRCSFVVAGAEALPFGDETFDTVVMWEVLEHVPAGAGQHVFSRRSSGAPSRRALVPLPPHATLFARVTDPAWWLAGHRHYDADTIRHLTAGAGLELDRLEKRGGIWQIAHMLNLYVAKWILRRRPFLEERSVRRLDREWRRQSGFVDFFLRRHESAVPTASRPQ